MKKSTLAALALALPLTIGNALATPATPQTTISDWGAGQWLGWISLNDQTLTTNSVLKLTFTYSDTDGFDYKSGRRTKHNEEEWSVFADNSFLVEGRHHSYWDSDVRPISQSLDEAKGESTTSIVFSSTENKDIFASILKHQNYSQTLDFWFSEKTDDDIDFYYPDTFKFLSASLNVTEASAPATTPATNPSTNPAAAAVPEPESYALFAAALTLLGAFTRRGRKTA